METKKEKALNFIQFLTINIACSFVQIIVLFILGVLLFFIGFFSGQFIWQVSGNAQLGLMIAPILSCAIIFSVYAFVWFVYWLVLFKEEGIKWFYWRVAFATLPLVIMLIMFNPQPDPMAMIPIPTEFDFSCLITGIILFPIYSVSIYKYVLLEQSSSHKVRNTIVLCVVMLMLGSVSFLSSWKMMDFIYY
ncbi:hypothetical protein DNHGIG_06750 [Collibacillus ludicampi]|uniref:Yip1 domain-containing protein n=1 Tax=Collibacillus ludicampi TaxID=2771369 RepID=A0AAV4LBF7_9BACL|nr:hypothetical protein [Collibacillus ludicampi]GIM45126.1 hypothetical protein DNHGIG_06750 [Collibacillus ludicampi]